MALSARDVALHGQPVTMQRAAADRVTVALWMSRLPAVALGCHMRVANEQPLTLSFCGFSHSHSPRPQTATPPLTVGCSVCHSPSATRCRHLQPANASDCRSSSRPAPFSHHVEAALHCSHAEIDRDESRSAAHQGGQQAPRAAGGGGKRHRARRARVRTASKGQKSHLQKCRSSVRTQHAMQCDVRCSAIQCTPTRTRIGWRTEWLLADFPNSLIRCAACAVAGILFSVF